MSDHLEHFGVLGMRWGHRKAESGASRSTNHMAKKDAQRHMDAKMFYGKTAGTKRKLLKAEIERKKKTVPGYEIAFNKHLENVNTEKSAKKAIRTRKRIDTTENTKRFVKKVLGVTGPLSVAAASALYLANKPRVDAFVADKFGINIP